jgi:hypothetical protein
MKQISFFLLLFFGIMSQNLFAQVTIEAFPMDPQTGQYNYFGVRASVPELQNNDVIVTGYIYDEGGAPNTNHPFTLTITAGDLTAETVATFYQTDPTANAAVVLGSITAYYAGVAITFDAANNRLKFNSTTDVFTVINQLNADYETHNDNYESQYPNLTAEQLDDMDDQTGFDEFKPYRDFEKLFTGFNSKRAELEALEINWLNNNFSGTDPDDYDFTFDDGENTIFNDGGSFQVGSDLYELNTNGLYVNGVPQAGLTNRKMPVKEFGNSIYTTAVFLMNPEKVLLAPGCKTNKNDKGEFPAGNGKFRLKVAINSFGFYSSAKGKVIHFNRKNNGNWKRVRTDMAAAVGGTIYSNLCNNSFQFVKREPLSGYSRKKQETARYSEWNKVYKTYTDQLSSSFDTPSGNQGVVLLKF